MHKINDEFSDDSAVKTKAKVLSKLLCVSIAGDTSTCTVTVGVGVVCKSKIKACMI